MSINFHKNELNNNPIATQRYSADPGVMVYEDTVYVYATDDIYEYNEQGEILENHYGIIKTLNCFSTKDFANWTDHGTIKVAGPDGAAKWANNSWAPAACHKKINGKEKFFLYFANSGGGIGVLTADSPEGPWVDPIGKALISRETPTCDSVLWLFDPAVLIDDDGTGYLCCGGGVPADHPDHPKTARVVRLGDDMISLACDPVMIDPPYLFEDSGILKVDNKYVYTYCSNFSTAGCDEIHDGTIQYMVSDDPMGPYEYKGEIFANPAVFFNDGNGNNHHTFFDFKGKYYMAYHARAVENSKLDKPKGYRSTQIDEAVVENGVIKPIIGTMKGVDQLIALNPFETVKASTFARESGITVVGCGDVITKTSKDSAIHVKGVDFASGAAKLEFTLKADKATKLEVRFDAVDGALAGCTTADTNGEFKTVTVELSNAAGKKDVYFLFEDEMELVNWIAK